MMECEKDKEKNNPDRFRTADGKFWTGLDPDTLDPTGIKERFDDRPLSMFPAENLKFMKAARSFQASAGGWTVPNIVDYKPECGDPTFQGAGLGTCYMHANINWAKWLVWLHTSLKFSPTGSDVDHYTNPNGPPKNGGWEWDLAKLWNPAFANDKFVQMFLQVASKCGITTDTLLQPNHVRVNVRGSSQEGGNPTAKENAIKMLNAYGPCFFAHDPGLYRSGSAGGYHAILCIGYDASKIYFMNSWQSVEWPVVTWEKFTRYTHTGAPQVYLAAIGSTDPNTTFGRDHPSNIWKDL